MVDYPRCDHGGNQGSDEEEPSEDHSNALDNRCQGKTSTAWHRMKWTDAMVRLLITIVSYIGEDAVCENYGGGGGARRKLSLLQKKGKWKSVSKVMAERGFFVSPQQCEDKFNDLNKRYKRLTDILGRGTSCRVVESPALLDMMDHLSEKAKDDVRKILSSKHLFYEEMCSYHNGNRLHLPTDPSIQRSLQLALRSGDDHELARGSHDDDGEEVDRGMDTDGRDEEGENLEAFHGELAMGGGGAGFFFPKRVKRDVEAEEMDYSSRPDSQAASFDLTQMFPEGSEAARVQDQLMRSRALQLQEQQLQIQAQMTELERQRARWRQLSKRKDRDVDRLRVENEKMRLENEQLTLQLKYRELKNNNSLPS
ncbi:unnamed protein product [Spirodela intermedia]|nr:unnamed protein product [Spirodela intermedia]CAA6663783.1 unnamed protein product [Spirodela intermedia]